MSFCDYHPDREAVGRCSICGRNVCSECSGNTDGPIVCMQCRTAPSDGMRESSGGSDSYTWAPPASADSNARSYLLAGTFGALLWIVVLIITAAYDATVIQSPYSPLVFFMSLSITFISFPEVALLALGFLGLSIKYNVRFVRYAFYAFIASLAYSIFYYVALNTIVPASPDPLSLLTTLSGFSLAIGFILALVVALSLWKLGNKSSHTQILNPAIILWCIYIPLYVGVNYILGFVGFAIASISLRLLLALLMLGLFYLESRVDVGSATRSW